MIETNRLIYKPVTVGREQLPRDIEDQLLSANLLDIQVYTDSEEIHRCIILAGANCRVNRYKPQTSLYYITHEWLSFRKNGWTGLQGMETDYPGDIYVSPQLDRFYFNGIEKFGTVASMIYGIRSFVHIQNGTLGLHSAMVYDKKTGLAHLLVGKNKVGKSTIGQALEDTSGRFMMISDDWNEVDIFSPDVEVEPVSVVFSPSTLNENYEPAFVSFNKPFYWKHNIRPSPRLGVGKIIEVYESDEELSTQSNFIFKTLSHIPFLYQPLNEGLFTCPSFNYSNLITEIQKRKVAIIEGYKYLKSIRSAWQLINDPKKNTIADATARVFDILVSNP